MMARYTICQDWEDGTNLLPYQPLRVGTAASLVEVIQKTLDEFN